MNPKPTLTAADAAVVKAMLARGDRQSDIAAFFKVNGGRISEINTGKKFVAVAPANDNLPRPGPYAVKQDVGAHIKECCVKSGKAAAEQVQFQGCEVGRGVSPYSGA